MIEGAGSPTAAAGVPAQRAPSGVPDSAAVLRGLGLEALVDVLESSAYGVCITGEEHRWVYLNPAGCRMLGRPFEELVGADYLLSFPPHEREALLALEHDQRQGDTGFYANTVVRPDGAELGIVWSGSVLHVDGQELAPAIFHPTQALRTPQGEAAALGAAAARMAAGGSLTQLLDALAAQAVAGSRAAGCVVLVEDDDGHLQALAGCAVPEDTARVLAAAQVRLGDLPGADLLAAGRLLLLSDDRSRLAADPTTAALAASDLDWEGSAKVPLHRGGDVVGCLVLLLPVAVTAPTESELTFWSALGAHASAALAEERLREQAAAHAAELERQRLGRDLHDSVASALFAVHARAQVITRGLARGDADLVAAAAADLQTLTEQAIADLRATVTSIRQPAAPAGVDLAAGLEELAATTTARHGVPVQVRAPRTVLPQPVAEHLLRLAGEALHNCVKHAAASQAVVELEAADDELVLVVADDGCGYDSTDAEGSGHGRRTMRERARLCGGRLTVDSSPGRGTRVTVRLPRPR